MKCKKCWRSVLAVAVLVACCWQNSTSRQAEVRKPAPVVLAGNPAPAASTWPMFGGTPSRNMVNTTDTKGPVKWTDKDKILPEHLKWVAEVGSKAYGGPVVADGKILVGTTARPRDKKKDEEPKAVIMAFNQADGKFLWQIVHDIPPELPMEARVQGMCSTPAVEGKFLYYVTPGCEVVCADTAGKVKWTLDMRKDLKVVPYHLGNCSPLVVGDLVMVVTGNGVNDENEIPSPKAPSFVAINKTNGKVAWQSNLPGEAIIEGQWSNPTVAIVKGKPQVIFPGGDCVLYGFDAETGKLIWQCNCNPTRKKGELDNYIVSTAVVVGERLYVGLGMYPENPKEKKYSYFVCLDVTKHGDVSLKSYDAKDPANKASALIWAFGGLIEPRPEKGRHARFGTTLSTAAVQDGLVYISEERGYLHCLDANTGARYWDHDFKASVWGSPYWVDGRVYIGTEDGDVVVFASGKKREILAVNGMDETIHSTPIVAGGVLYVLTKSKLYALR